MTQMQSLLSSIRTERRICLTILKKKLCGIIDKLSDDTLIEDIKKPKIDNGD